MSLEILIFNKWGFQRCSQCLKSFLTRELGDKADYSGFHPTT